MKKSIASTISFFYLLLLAYAFLGLTACKKTSAAETTHSPFDGKLSFTYNGTQYVLPFKEGVTEWFIMNGGIYIYRPDIFNGTIYYPYTNCAYLENGLSVQLAANCQLSSSGSPIDSVSVYIYQSGSMNISYKNCYHKSVYDIVTGNTDSYDVCDADGTFNLILKNKENKTINITDGSIQQYSFRR
ncbi:MAG: hypothetical protein ABI707_14570 [Ferruginibacter sp.]